MHVVLPIDTKTNMRRQVSINRLKQVVFFDDYSKVYKKENYQYIYYINHSFFFAQAPELALQSLAAIRLTGLYESTFTVDYE